MCCLRAYNNNNNNNNKIGDSATNAGSAAEAAAIRKAAKYAGLEKTHIFQPVAVENLGTMNASAYGFLAGLGQKISAISGDDRETCYLFQRISVLIYSVSTLPCCTRALLMRTARMIDH